MISLHVEINWSDGDDLGWKEQKRRLRWREDSAAEARCLVDADQRVGQRGKGARGSQESDTDQHLVGVESRNMTNFGLNMDKMLFIKDGNNSEEEGLGSLARSRPSHIDAPTAAGNHLANEDGRRQPWAGQ